MIDVHLIGYTADLEHLVLDLDGEANGRYRLVVDADLLATLAEMHERSAEQGRGWPGDELVEDDDGDEDDTEDWDDEDDEDEDDDGDDEDDEDGDAGREAEVVPGPGPEPAPAPRPPDPAPGPEPAIEPEPEPEPEPERATTPSAEPPRRSSPAVAGTRPAAPPSEPERREATLSPAEIQGLLRAGRSAKSVAKAAGTDVAWIERWSAPILEERARILREAHAGRLERPRLGTSRAPLGEAVQRSLAERKVDPDEISWETSRRADGRWKVSVKYRHRNRSRTASWSYDPRDGALEPSSDLARELGFRAPRAKRPSPQREPRSEPEPKVEAESG